MADRMELEKKRQSIANNLAGLTAASGQSRLSTVNRPRPVVTSKGSFNMRNDGCCSPRSPLSPKSPGIYDILKVSDGQKEYYDANLKNQYNEGKDNEAEEWVCAFCVIVNAPLAMHCRTCNAAKGGACAGEWTCAEKGCGAVNRGNAIECKQCRKHKNPRDSPSTKEPTSPTSPGGSRMRTTTTYRGSKMNQIASMEKGLKTLG